MKNTELLQNAIGMIGEDLIDDADRKPRRPHIIRWSAVACACLAVIIAVSVGWLWRGDAPGVEPPDVDPPIVDVAPQNGVIVTSWEELKALYEAAQISEEKLIETERRMERYCDHYSDSFGLFLNRDPNVCIVAVCFDPCQRIFFQKCHFIRIIIGRPERQIKSEFTVRNSIA